MRLEDSNQKQEQARDGLGEKLLKTRSILLSGEINKESADRFIKDLLVLEAESSDPVKVFINSPGGDVDAGFAIYDMVRFVSCPVIMVGTGLIASAASLILLAVPAERRVGLPTVGRLPEGLKLSMRLWASIIWSFSGSTTSWKDAIFVVRRAFF